jgi:uncharacterized repeat protein (TIGR02543 family)
MEAVFGQTLGEMNLPEGWSWDEGGSCLVGEVGERVHPATYALPDTANYNPVSQDIPIAVKKSAPDVPPHRALTAAYGQTLAEMCLAEGWSWDERGCTPVGNAGEARHPATYTPRDEANYSKVPQDITLNIKKAVPKADPPSAISTTTDRRLGDIELPRGWSFDEGSDAPVGAAGTNARSVTYTPEDTANYTLLQNTVTLIVNEAAAEPAPSPPAPAKIKIKVVAAGKSKVKSLPIGKKIGKLPKAARKGYVFTGWYTKKAGGKKIGASCKVTKKTPNALYAHWKKIDVKTGVYGKIKGCAVLRVRKAPSASMGRAFVIGYITRGEAFEVTGRKGGWYKISFAGKKGYVWGGYVGLMKTGETM